MQKYVEVHFVRAVSVEINLVGTVFVVFLISSHINTGSSIKFPTYLLFSQLYAEGLQIKPFAHTMFFWIFTLTTTLFLLSHLHSNLNHICFVNVLDWFIPVIRLKVCKFKYFVLFETHTLLDRLSRVLQLPPHLSTLTRN